jgi:glycosyltransferase involved in cell wall biosynthesis
MARSSGVGLNFLQTCPEIQRAAFRDHAPADRRLLVVTESLGVGGAESHLIRTLPRLVEYGWSIATFCVSERGERAEQVEAAGVEVFAPPRLARRKDSFLRYPAHVSVASNKLYWLMRRWRPRIAHFYLPGPYLIGAHVAIAARIPIKIMSRRSLSDYQQNWPLVARLERRLHTRMDAVVGNSRAVVRQLIDEGVPEAKVRLIYNGIEASSVLPDRNEARQALGLDDDTLVGVVIANLIPYKGHRELIGGLSHVEQELPGRWRILLVGRDYGVQSELEALATRYGVSHRIRFLGQRSDIPALLAAADFGVLTSHEEGFSNVILEGMAAGLAMIVTDVGGNAEAVVHAETGLVVPPRDPNAIGDAILRLSRDPEQRKRFGAAARKRVEKEFSIDKCVKAHADLYEEMLDKIEARKIAAE